MYCVDIGALTASKLTGLNKNTTHRLYGLLRARVLEMAKGEAAPFTGSVEVDESYSGRVECAGAEAEDRAESCCHRSAQEEGKSLLLSGHELLEG